MASLAPAPKGEKIEKARGSRWRAALPFVVSGAFLAFVLSRMDLSQLPAQWSARVPMVMLPALIVYGAFTLAVEAVSIVRVVPTQATVFGLWPAARAKAASYLLVIVNYAVGAGTLAILLSRHAQLRMGTAAGAVFLIALLDLLMLMLAGVSGASLSGGGEGALSFGSVGLAIGGIVAGFVGLRAPIAMGPLDRIRHLTMFDAARTAPIRLLFEIAGLRLAMVLSFLGISYSALVAFSIEVPLAEAAVGFTLVALVGALPFTAAGLGTGQAAFVYLFRDYSSPERLLACSLTLSLGMLLLRAGMGLVFAREFTREALAAVREEDEAGEPGAVDPTPPPKNEAAAE